MTVHDLLHAVTEAGYRVSINEETGQPQLSKRHPEVDLLPPELMAQLKARREEVIECLAACELCGRVVATRELKERMCDPAFCTQAGATRWDKERREMIVFEHRCPFKSRES